MTGLGSSCGACKFLRRKCSNECVFAPYFSYEQAANHFAAVHKVFGASNVSKLLLHLPIHTRSDAAITVAYEALARIRDPVYGCVAHIFALQEQVANLQEEIEILEAQMANLAYPFYQNVGLQTPLLNEAMNLQLYQNLQQAAPMVPPGRDLDDLVNSQQVPTMSYEDIHQQGYFCDSDEFMDRLFEDVDHEILTLYPWLSNGNDIRK